MIKGEAFEAGRTMHLKVEIIDKTITLWVNGNQVLQNTMENLPLNAGTVGLNSRQANTVYVDNVKVTSYDLPTGELQNAAGRVVDTENSPIEGALAELLDSSKAVIKQTTTDALGNYKFKNIPLGEYTVRITSGKYTEEIQVTVTAGEDYVVIDKAVLGETADKTKLEDLIRQAEEIDLSLYTEETAQAVRDALAAAKAVAEDPDAVQKDVDEAAEALQAAVDDLKEKADEPRKGDEQNPGGNDGDDTDEPDGTGTGEPVQISRARQQEKIMLQPEQTPMAEQRRKSFLQKRHLPNVEDASLNVEHIPLTAALCLLGTPHYSPDGI